MSNLRIRTGLTVLGLVLTLIWILPNMVNVDEWSWYPSKSKLNYGLDIQGGLHLVMGADIEGVVREGTTRLISSLTADLPTENVVVRQIEPVDSTRGEIRITVDPASMENLQKFINNRYSTMLQVVSSTADTMTLRYYDAYMIDYRDRVLQQSIETIRNRIDEFGVAEPSIARQGTNRILVQLPGMADAERAKELINTTARLDFMIVSNAMDMGALSRMIEEAEKAGEYSMSTLKYGEYVTRVNADLQGKIPEGTVVYFEKNPNVQRMEEGAMPYLLQTDSNLGGKDLDDAFVSYGQFGEPEVALRFNSAGGTRFADLTGNNVGRQMAIVLDRVVKSAPNLRERIGGGSAVITLGGRDREGMMNEARMISTSLRAGALPASLEQLEERRVGPSLGADAIERAKIGSYVGAFLVVAFIIIYYKMMGLIASICLGINVLGIFALLTTLGATLTLPGIAGIALTVGVAIDANVLINERIRDELRTGASFKLAVQEGFNRAMSAILDANITSAITAAILLYFGTGPIRGFAVTLLIGILTTMWANVFVTKVIVDLLINRFGFKKLSV